MSDAEADIELVEDIGGRDLASEMLSIQRGANESAEALAESIKGKYPRADIEMTDFKLKTDSDGKSSWQAKSGDRLVDVTQVQTDMASGDIYDAFEEASPGIADGPRIKPRVDDLEAKFKQSPVGQDMASQEEFKAVADDARGRAPKDAVDAIDKPGSITQEDLDAFQKSLSESQDKAFSELKDSVTEMLEEKKNYKGPDDPSYRQRVSKWLDDNVNIKNLVKLLALGGVIFAIVWFSEKFVDWINNMRHASSGCWSTTQQKKCKIDVLTCDSNDLANSTLCIVSTDSSGTGGDFVPLIRAHACSCTVDSKGNPSIPIDTSGWDQDAKMSQNTCSKFTNRNNLCPITEKFLHPSRIETTQNDYACPNASGCLVKNEACSAENQLNSDCSKWCSSDYLTTLPGQVLSCTQTTAFDVIANAIPNLFNDLIGTIEKILLYLAIGLVIFLVAIFVFKEVGSVIEGSVSSPSSLSSSGGKTE